MATTPIVCEKGRHVLGAAPDDGSAQDLWEYCCNCHNFWRINLDEPAFAQCPVCERPTTARYLCDRCRTMSLDSSAPAKRREVYLSLEGVPVPHCPGCSGGAGEGALEHECEAFAATFTTAREACPFCHENVAAKPSFPASVSEYLAKFSGDKLEVAFDAESKQLIRASPGEFFLLRAADAAHGDIVLPRLTRFDSQHDFLRRYKDYYDCDEPAAGEVIVLWPATVQKEGKGWSLKSVGRLRVGAGDDINVEGAARTSAPSDTPSDDGAANALPSCPKCGAAAKPHHKFCKKCGTAINSSDFSPAASPENRHAAAEDAAPESSVSAEPSGLSNKKTWAALAVVGVAVLISIGLATGIKGVPSAESRLNDAINRGNLLSPPGESAYDLFAQLKREGASRSALAAYKEKLLSRLTPRPQALLDQVVNPGGADGTLSEWEEAQKFMAWAAELKPEDEQLAAKAAYCEGRAAYLKNLSDAATTAYRRAADLDKSWAMPLNSLGLMLNERKRYSEARNFLNEAIRRNPGWALPYNNMGTSYFLDNDLGDAQTYYRKAQDLAPNWARPHAWLGSIAVKQRDYCAAVEEFQKALTLSTPNMSNWNPQKIQKDLDDARARCVGD